MTNETERRASSLFKPFLEEKEASHKAVEHVLYPGIKYPDLFGDVL